MESSFYFYDLETSGIDARSARVMQFAGQRTDMHLRPIAEPDNILIKLSEDILPDPDAIMVTGITPQSTLSDGITEYEFLRYFTDNIAKPETIFTGFNSVRFDDEFMRFMHYRNFYDAYEWSWRDGRSRWDILDVLRMTRALRPDGIVWPFTPDGKPSNRLEMMTEVNGLDHESAHDALSDVKATIAVARLVYNKQQKLFEYLLAMRSKHKVKELVESGAPFIYTCGGYANVHLKTTAVMNLGGHPGKQGNLVYDLRQDPENFVHMSAVELANLWYERVEDETKRFPIKTLQYNRCPAVAPLSVVESNQASLDNIQLNLYLIRQHQAKLLDYPDFYKKLLQALKILDKKAQAGRVAQPDQADGQLYDGFFNDRDKVHMSVVRAATAPDVASLEIDFQDLRLQALLKLYKARNFKASLSHEQVIEWDNYRRDRLTAGGDSSLLAKFFNRINELANDNEMTSEKRFLLEELQLYGQSIMPDSME